MSRLQPYFARGDECEEVPTNFDEAPDHSELKHRMLFPRFSRAQHAASNPVSQECAASHYVHALSLH